jgi:hypothetical protein
MIQQKLYFKCILSNLNKDNEILNDPTSNFAVVISMMREGCFLAYWEADIAG